MWEHHEKQYSASAQVECDIYNLKKGDAAKTIPSTQVKQVPP